MTSQAHESQRKSAESQGEKTTIVEHRFNLLENLGNIVHQGDTKSIQRAIRTIFPDGVSFGARRTEAEHHQSRFGVVEQLGLFTSLELEVHDLQGVPFRLPGQQPAIGSSYRERRDIE